MKQIIYYSLIAISLIPLGLGMIFLIAAVRDPRRILTAFFMLLAGGTLMGVGLAGLYRRAANSPDNLAQQLLQLAKQYDGALTEALACAGLGVPLDALGPAFELLVGQGHCTIQYDTQGGRVYKFETLNTKVSRVCEYCNTTYPVKQALSKCPSCGGELVLKKG